jgi:hypothetical protein
MEAGGTASRVALSYQAEHPLEPVVTTDEIDAAVAEAKLRTTRKSMGIEDERRSRVRKSNPRV